MRYAIVSDIHANRQAWAAVCADARALEARVPVCLGDVVGYGPNPREVLESVRRHCAGNILAGNHDAAAAGTMDDSVFNPVAREAIAWTRGQLGEEALAFLGQLPMAISSGGILFVHAEVVDPGRFGYVETVEEARENFASHDYRVVFLGHTHRPTIFRLEEDGSVSELPDEDCVLDPEHRYLVNVGSVGEPRSLTDPRARYVVYDSDTGEVFFRRVEFDVEAYRRDLAASELEATPFFLTVVDHQREEQALLAMAGTVERSAAGRAVVQELVLPEDAEGGAGVKGRRASRRRQPVLVLAALPLVAMLAGLVYWLSRPNDRPAVVPPAGEEGSRGSDDTAAVPDHLPDRFEVKTLAGEVGRVVAGSALVPVEPPRPEEVIEPVAVQEESPVAPPEEPAPKATVTVEPVPPLGELPELRSLVGGVIFYAPFDEFNSLRQAGDLSGLGREIDLGAARIGEVGQVARAIQLTAGEPLVSAARPLPPGESLTLAFWLRMPAPPPGEPADQSGAQTAAPVVVVSLPGLLDVHLEGGRLVADLDRTGEKVAVDYPADDRWHHVLLESRSGVTTLWLDASRRPDPVNETLPPRGATPVAISLGSPGANFLIDELIVWNRVLSRDEHCLLFRRGEVGQPLLPAREVVAHWAFDEAIGARLFRDAEGGRHLGAYRSWSPVPRLAPDPVPLTGIANRSAAQVLRLGESPEGAGEFRFDCEVPFTYEGWVKLGGGDEATLGATLGGSDAERSGWRLAARRGEGEAGHLAFIVESATGKVQALAKDLPLFDDRSHHFAAVWNPMTSASHGTIQLFLDNIEVASTQVERSTLGGGPSWPFHIEAGQRPVVLDELRFTRTVLTPEGFLTAGSEQVAEEPDSPEEDVAEESVMRRREREARERREREAEERRMRAEERASRQADDEEAREQRRAEEEAKRRRRKIGQQDEESEED